jgi:hypothetical protein
MSSPASEVSDNARSSHSAPAARCGPAWLSLTLLGVAAALLLPPVRTTWLSVYGARWAYILVVSALISLGLTPAIARLAHRADVLDLPASRKVHAAPTPLLGGLAIYLAFTVAILANSILDRQVIAILVGGTLLVLVGILDDVYQMPPSSCSRSSWPRASSSAPAWSSRCSLACGWEICSMPS